MDCEKCNHYIAEDSVFDYCPSCGHPIKKYTYSSEPYKLGKSEDLIWTALNGGFAGLCVGGTIGIVGGFIKWKFLFFEWSTFLGVIIGIVAGILAVVYRKKD